MKFILEGKDEKSRRASKRILSKGVSPVKIKLYLTLNCSFKSLFSPELLLSEQTIIIRPD